VSGIGMMDLTRLKMLAERLRVESVGDPEWVESKGVFEYPSQTISPKSAGVDELLVKALGLAAVSDARLGRGRECLSTRFGRSSMSSSTGVVQLLIERVAEQVLQGRG
jgi:hypothetical protein